MSAVSVIRQGRRFLEARMTETVTISDRTGVTTDPVTLVVTPTTVIRYSGPARLKYTALEPANLESGAQYLTAQRLEVHIPVDMGDDIQTGDIVTVTASTVDDQLVGRRYRIQGAATGGQVTARRFPVEEVS